MQGISSVASRNNPIKYTDPDRREVDDFENNKGFSLNSLDLTNKEIQKDSELNKYNTPLPLVALDKISSYTSSSVGISVAKRTAAYKQAIAPVTNLGGPWVGAGCAIVAGKVVDKWLEEKGL